MLGRTTYFCRIYACLTFARPHVVADMPQDFNIEAPCLTTMPNACHNPGFSFLLPHLTVFPRATRQAGGPLSDNAMQLLRARNAFPSPVPCCPLYRNPLSIIFCGGGNGGDSGAPGSLAAREAFVVASRLVGNGQRANESCARNAYDGC